jgi:hypothetical protein
MYATSLSMSATVGFSVSTTTDTTVMRMRQPAGQPLKGFIVDRNGVPTMVAKLELYMDAPDMDVLLSSHDLHSKPLEVSLEGPVTFLSDGRIAISVRNTADIPVRVNLRVSGLFDGSVDLVVPRNEMKLQLLSPLVRGGSL